MKTEAVRPRERVDLQDARDALPTTVEELARLHDASNRAAKRALQYLVHTGQAEVDDLGWYS